MIDISKKNVDELEAQFLKAVDDTQAKVNILRVYYDEYHRELLNLVANKAKLEVVQAFKAKALPDPEPKEVDAPPADIPTDAPPPAEA